MPVQVDRNQDFLLLLVATESLVRAGNFLLQGGEGSASENSEQATRRAQELARNLHRAAQVMGQIPRPEVHEVHQAGARLNDP